MLSDAKIRAAKPRDRAYKLTDGHRLYLEVMTSGSKLWRWSYSYADKQKVMALGDYPRISLLEARLKRDQAKSQLEEGIDPLLAKKLRVETNLEASKQTFERVARGWHDNTKGRWSGVHASDVLLSLERDVFPAIGDLPIAKITAPIVLDVLKIIEARGAIETAKRVRQRISAVFTHAGATGLVTSDPAEKLGAVLKPLFKGRQPAITDLPALRKMINDAEIDFARPVTRLALRFLALTAVRPNEIRGATWYEFESLNGKAPLWRIPALRMKGGHARKAEVGGDHLVPLAPQSVEVLRALWPLTGKCDLLFPSDRHGHKPMSENAIGYLLNRAGYHGHHVPHGFRAAFSTIMNEWAEREGKDHDRSVIDLMLAHVPKDKVERAYNRAAYLERRRELALIWADMITKDLPPPEVLLRRPSRGTGRKPSRRSCVALPADVPFPLLSQAR